MENERISKDEEKLKRAGKDSIFIDLFHQPKYALELAKALNPSMELTENDIEFVTLHSVLMIRPYNDLGLLVKENLLICSEAQSTWSLNVLVRMFMYLAETYHRYIQNHKEMNLYGSKKIKIPTPKCYVIYTGQNKDAPETLSLAEEFFTKDSPLDLKIKALKTEGKGNIIEEYIRFCHILDEQVKLYGQNKQAVEETIRICQNEDILSKYLEERKKEVQSIMSILFSQEEVTERYVYERQMEARKEARKEERENIALNMLRKKVNIEDISQFTQLPLAHIKQLAKTL